MTNLSRPRRQATPPASRGPLGIWTPVAVLCCLAQGCLIPQSVEPENTRPHTLPRVDLKSLPDYLYKPQIALYPRGPNEDPKCHCVLSFDPPLKIIADDPTVSIEGRLFVDYDLAVPTSQRRIDTRVLQGSFQTSDTVRDLVPVLTIDADQFGLTPNASVVHVFEFVLAEQQGFASSDTVSPPQRATKDGWDSSILKFSVVVLPPDASRPHCLDQAVPPQTQVCTP